MVLKVSQYIKAPLEKIYANQNRESLFPLFLVLQLSRSYFTPNDELSGPGNDYRKLVLRLANYANRHCSKKPQLFPVRFNGLLAAPLVVRLRIRLNLNTKLPVHISNTLMLNNQEFWQICLIVTRLVFLNSLRSSFLI